MGWGNYEEEQADADLECCLKVLQSPGVTHDGYKDPVGSSPFEDPESEEESESDRGHAPVSTAEKRRAQKEIFRAHANRRAQQITEKEIKEVVQYADEAKLSVRDILAKEENCARIANPRDYQTELFQRAKDENIIAVLDTGTGKTHIATLLLRHVLDVELETRAKGGPHKVAFFLVDSVNLVFQQANVLRCGLDQKVEGLCGAMGVDLWQKSTWDRYFDENMVIVCTAEVLSQCMMHSFISISRTNILIFDEAHHAKNNHPYARLMKEYYVNEPNPSQRPRIFGMTASPVDANTDVREAALKLENLLHCKIATASEETLNRNQINRANEEVSTYPRLQAPYETIFHQKLKDRFANVKRFEKLFSASRIISSELGRWASDTYWSFALTEDESRKHQRLEELQFNKKKDGHDMEKLNKDIALLQEAAYFLRQQDFGIPTLSAEDLSSKVLALSTWLTKYYEQSDKARCIVFVEKRQTANLLHLIFKHIGGPNLRSEVLVGVNTRMVEVNRSLKSQVLTVSKFRRGEINCLFSTSVAEEGLDIPQCNLVVRFDLYRTMIGYIQSRGRARHKNSTYLHMVEEGNTDQRARVFRVFEAERIMRGFCEGLPQERFLDKLDMASVFDTDGEVYQDPKSGAKLTYRSSLSVLAHFVASIPGQPQEMGLLPTYILSRVTVIDPSQDGKLCWQCEVILPECAPIISVIGKPCTKKAVAKCSAAFQMCRQLLEKNYLDENLLPTYQKKLPAMRNAQLALSEKKKGQYPMLVKPNFWDVGYGTIPERLYLTFIDVAAGLERPHHPLGLLTRHPMPELPRFPIFLKDGRPSDVVSTPIPRSLEATAENLELFTRVTLLVFEDIYNKEYENHITTISYWLVPIRSQVESYISQSSDPSDLIDMDQVREICDPSASRTQWTKDMDDEYLNDKYIVDKFNGGRRFYSNGVVPHLKPQSPVPSSVPKYKFMANILDFSVSLWTKSRQKLTWDLDQPVIEVERIPFRRNFLALVEENETEVKEHLIAYACPQPLRISTLPTYFVAMCYVFPAILHRFEDYLIALDACEHLGLNIRPRLALEALTKDSENSGEHGEEKINFRSGMGPNYERLEFLGDCFLKMATSISTFVLQPNENEFEFHVRRMLMLCNQNLFETAKKLNLVEYVRTHAFSRRQWYPKGMKLLRGKKTGDGPVFHSLGDKSVADVCEAFIGAAFLQNNTPGKWNRRDWDEAVKAVTIFARSEDHTMKTFSDYYAAYEKPKYQVAPSTATQIDLAHKIKEKHPYHFKYPRLLRSAFMHPSQAYMWEKVPNYQRLEFLGDALLDMAFIMHLFYRHPDKDPQWLTEHKAPMVSNKFLGAVSVKLGFHTHIRQNNAALTAEIRDYVAHIEEAESEARGAVDYWVGVPQEPPKCLADVVEAYVAAMFVDSEFDFGVVQRFFDMHIKRYFEDMTLPAYESFASSHPVTRLGKLLSIDLGCREWCMGAVETPSVIPGVDSQIVAMVSIHGKVVFDGVGRSGRYARPRAAGAALEALEGLVRYQYRQRYGCDCEDDMEGDGDESKSVAEEKMKEALGPAF